MKKITAFIKKEVVLCAAILLAVISAFFVLPDRGYLEYIDFRTLSILFCLMAVMAGFRKIGVFSRIAEALLIKVRSVRMIMLILVMLCFFCSMLITNDVALITFVPLTIIVLKIAGEEQYHRLLLPIVIMQTIAANLGSMLTPIGNPQNLYLYGQSGMSFSSFLGLMLPYSALSLFLLLSWIFISTAKSRTLVQVTFQNPQKITSKSKLMIYSLLFLLSLLTVARVISYWIVLAIVVVVIVITDFTILKNVDYCLLLTFVGFFIFIGNIGRIPQIHDFLQNIINGREVITSIISSQFMSNVPAALLLSGFTDNYRSLIIGSNLGGLGTLIASMASLISFKYVAAEAGISKGKYLGRFTIANILFLAILVGLWLLIR